jgi:hypothetical protein
MEAGPAGNTVKPNRGPGQRHRARAGAPPSDAPGS